MNTEKEGLGALKAVIAVVLDEEAVATLKALSTSYYTQRP